MLNVDSTTKKTALQLLGFYVVFAIIALIDSGKNVRMALLFGAIMMTLVAAVVIVRARYQRH